MEIQGLGLWDSGSGLGISELVPGVNGLKGFSGFGYMSCKKTRLYRVCFPKKEESNRTAGRK